MKADGSISSTNQSPEVLSGAIGFLDRPICRTTVFTAREIDDWMRIKPFIRAVDKVFRDNAPERYAAQLKAVKQTPSEFVIRGTAFTTVTVNRNFRTAAHKDEGDLPEGFGVMSVLSAGNYSGGYLVFPKYRVAVDMRTRDVLLADVHEYHGNTPLVGVEGGFERISTVLYYRSNMRFCGTPARELKRAKNRRPGDRLNGR